MSLSSRRSTTMIFLVAIILLAAGFYYIFDNFLRTTGEEIAKAWYYGEVVNIQEGQILPAISKNQNLFEKSPFIRSVILIDKKDPERTLFSVGDSAEPVSQKILDLSDKRSNVISTFRNGFLSYRLLVKLPNPNGLYIIYDISSDFLIRSYLIALAVSILFATYLVTLTIQVTNSERKKRDELRRDLLNRLAHDINSPLLSISGLSLKVKKFDQHLHVGLENATASIRQLFAQTDKVDKKLSENAEVTTSAIDHDTEMIPLAPVLKEFVIQKRGEYSEDMDLTIDLDISKDSLNAFVKINVDDFKRHMANILKNSLEAMAGRDRQEITIALSANAATVTVSISDSGCGISADLLPNLGKKGVSFGKTGGHGLGLHFAMASIEHWHGNIKIDSAAGIGTKISVELPALTPPRWYAHEVSADSSTKLVFIDDDLSMIDRWKTRLSLSEKTFLNFNSAAAFRQWFKDGGQFEEKLLFVFDYHLGENNTGLSVIDELGISKESMLVTSAYLDEQVLTRAKALGVHVMPKVLV